MEYKPLSQSSSSSQPIKPRIIIHGGAGNILPSNLPPSQYTAYTSSLRRILDLSYAYLTSSTSNPPFPSSNNNLNSHPPTALDVATYAVTLLENDPLFNSGHGAVFTREGKNELEASVMVSKGRKKRGVGVSGVTGVKNPIKLAAEMLRRGDEDLEGGNGEHRGPMVRDEKDRLGGLGKKKGRGAQGHSHISGAVCEELAQQWGLETLPQGDQSYYFTQQRWDEHIAGLEREKSGGDASWDANAYVRQGTCGAVVLDGEGTLCVATSTGGMTNKLPGRVGDTPTLGAGFWAEKWEEGCNPHEKSRTGWGESFDVNFASMLDCLPIPGTRSRIMLGDEEERPVDVRTILELEKLARPGDTITRALAISGTGNGDSFLRTAAAHAVCSILKYSPSSQHLTKALRRVTGPDGELQRSAGNRWGKTGEGEGGMIGIEYVALKGKGGEMKAWCSDVVAEYNCGGMFRAWVDERGERFVRVWRGDEEGYLDE